jgi:superfamily II DNA or RNA helicase
MTRQLREYQREAVDGVYGQWGDGIDRTAVVLPTGTGKTDVIAAIAVREARAGKRVLALAHRDELLEQITDRCRMHDPSIPIGRVQAKTNQTRRPITVASTPTLYTDKRRERLAPPDVVLYDECHHAPSPKSMEVLRWAGVYGRPERSTVAKLCGFTATPVRGDKRGMGDVLQDVAFKRDIGWAVDQGFLVRPRGKVVVADHMDLNKAKVRAGDYTDSELGDMVEQDTDQIVRAWLEHAADRLTVAFTPNVASAWALAAEFLSYGVAAEVVIGTTPREQRQLIYKRLAIGETRVLVSVMVTTEGWDCPPVSCVLQCRPTRLPGLYTQMVGRVLRPSPETGKTDALVLDVVGASRGQKLVTLIDLSVSSDYDASAIDDLPCERCGAWPSKAAAARQGEHDAPVCQCNEGAAQEKQRNRLVGPAQYEDLDLLLSTSPFTWLQTHAGTPFLPAGGDRMAVLWLDKASDLYIVGHCAMKGLTLDGHRLGAGLTLDAARRMAEDWATAHGLQAGLNTHSRKAGWRKVGNASAAQLKWAHELRIPHPEKLGKAELSDAISVGRASRMLDRR